MEKTCTKCSVLKPITEFYENGKCADGSVKYRPDCKVCVRTRLKGRTREAERIWHVKRRYGLTLEEAEKYWYAECCYLCGSTDPKDRRGKFQIDHCHVTGVVRGPLCMPCNVGIGYLQDDPELMRRAADYVERYRSG
ncbi:endonuclease VII [Mycobacterium phage CloudWang3]|uniref:EndoVII n=1 Tax=Mycobacterium phage CloudWang3 TaxID=1391430 RepID=V5R426_9CAUD|nr:endonuclease VII [Mycobacterium phage CloudWang3]AHB29853.1 EndoVII [Mycobacterium phage CloudWang3]